MQAVEDNVESGVDRANQEEEYTDGAEHLHRGEQHTDAGDDQEEAPAVAEPAHLALAPLLARTERHEGDAVARLDEGDGGSAGVRVAIGQQANELHQPRPPHRTKAAGQVGDASVHHIAAEGVENAIADVADEARVAAFGACAHHQVVLWDLIEQAVNIVGAVLAVGIEHQDHVAVRRPHSGLDRRAIALVIRLAQHLRSRLQGDRSGIIAAAVVHHDDLGGGLQLAQAADHLANRLRLVVGRDDHRQAVIGGQLIEQHLLPRWAGWRQHLAHGFVP